MFAPALSSKYSVNGGEAGCRSLGYRTLNVKSEMDDVPVLNNIVLAF